MRLPLGTQIIQFLEGYGLETYFKKSLYSSETFTADAGTDLLAIAGSYLTGDVVQLTTTTTLPAGLTVFTDYYVISISDTTLKLAATIDNAYLENCIDITDAGTGTHTIKLLSYKWIQDRIEKNIVPYVEERIRNDIEVATQYIEYYSGTGSSTLFLNRRYITSIDKIEYVTAGDYVQYAIDVSSVKLLAKEGVLKSVINHRESTVIAYSTFPRGTNNIKITYTAGWTNSTRPNDLNEAVKLLTAEVVLGELANRTGGGALTVKEFSRNYGDRGKYTNARNDFTRQALAILNKYSTGVTGS